MYYQIYNWAHTHFFIVSAGLIVSLLFIILLFAYRQNRVLIWINRTILVLYIAGVLYITVVSRIYYPNAVYELHISGGILYALFWGNQKLFWEDIANVILFFPIGGLLRVSFEKQIHWCRTIAFGAVLSALIEVTQLLLHCGYCDGNDFVHNVLGIILGFGVGCFLVWKV